MRVGCTPVSLQVVANLPQGAPELLGAALRGVFHGEAPGTRALPRCHVYAFSRADDPAADILSVRVRTRCLSTVLCRRLKDSL